MPVTWNIASPIADWIEVARSCPTPDDRGTRRPRADRNFCEIPVVSMVRQDHLQLERLVTRRRPVRVRINVQNRVTGPVDSANVVGEIRGWEHPEQVVVVGAHLDSWDLGQGAIDNGFGVAAVLGAADAI